MQFLDFVLFLTCTVLPVATRVARVTCRLQFVNESVPITMDVIHLGLLSENLVTKRQHTLVSVSSNKATARISILYFVDHEAAIFSCREEPIVVVAEPHALDGASVGLNLTELLHGELPDLHSTRMPSLANTSEESFAIGKDLEL